mmetsp:Transcript_8575/g.19201  ORF Transcript_8575/g.19201 Transcript_8575/m.19201 type:complete len:206 (+) Transcript_8575:416-1033(+)
MSCPFFFDPGAALLAPSVMDNFSTASCSFTMESMVWAWNICPIKPGSRKGSSGWILIPDPGMAWTNCASNDCMFWSCIIAAMALVSKVPTQAGASTPSSSSSSSTGAASSNNSLGSPSLGSSSPEGSMAASSSSAPCIFRSFFSFSAFSASFFCASAAANKRTYSSSCSGLRMSSHICLRTSKEPVPSPSSCDMERSVLRITSRT